MHYYHAMASTVTERPTRRTPSPVRERFWFQAVVVVVALAAFALIASKLVHRDVVTGWQVVATCSAGTVPSAVTVTTGLDPSSCAAPATARAPLRGWPVVPVVLPASAGLDPDITAVSSDTRARTFHIDYAAAPFTSTTAGGAVIVFVEVPPTSLPAAPFTVAGAGGPVTVTSVQGG